LAVLQLYSASKSFGKKVVLEDVSIKIETGDILGIFGRNGSGKSTLLQLLFGTLKSDAMELRIDGIAVHPSEVIQKQYIGYLPQQPFLPKDAKVRDLIPIYHSTQKKQDAVFYDSQVAKITGRRVGELSQGERKYFELILVGNLDHPFLMLDEPFSMLEPLQTEAVKKFLMQLKKTKGLMITDHYYNDVLDITTQNMVIKEGKSIPVNGTEDLRKFEYLRKH
jgi:ABC-type multidrug transport system ATPase subunit